MRILSMIALVLFVCSLAAPVQAGIVEDCEQERDPDRSIRGCTAVIRSGEFSGRNLANAYGNRGYAYAALGEHRRAIEDYDQVLRLDPGLAIAYNSRGIAYNNLGEYARAIENYDQALLLDPRSAEAYYNRGNAYANLGDAARAIEDYDQALRLDPGLADAYNNRANARCHLGQVEASLDDRIQMLRLGVLTAKDAQRHLRDQGFYKGAIDGDFGPASRKALRGWTTAGCP